MGLRWSGDKPFSDEPMRALVIDTYMRQSVSMS